MKILAQSTLPKAKQSNSIISFSGIPHACTHHADYFSCITIFGEMNTTSKEYEYTCVLISTY